MLPVSRTFRNLLALLGTFFGMAIIGLAFFYGAMLGGGH